MQSEHQGNPWAWSMSWILQKRKLQIDIVQQKPKPEIVI
jgi:hypothetical protein